MDYAAMAATAKKLIIENGREITITKLSSEPPNPLKPWRGPSVPVKIGHVSTYGVFAVPNTSIPTESRGLAFDWIDDELLKRARHVVIVPALDIPILDDYNIITDAGEDFTVIWGQCLQPGSTRIFYVFGLAQ